MSRAADLAWVFLPLSLATVGGGQSALPGIRHQVVDVHHWLHPAEFVDMFALSRMAPGPGSMIVTLIGWRVDGLLGAIVATLAIFAPTSLVLYGIARFWSAHRGARWQTALETGLRPVAAGLMLAACWVLLADLAGGWTTRAIALLATAALLVTRVPPLVLLAGGSMLCAGGFWLGILTPS
jgi:chromate transporter